MACHELLLQQSLSRREVRGLDSTQSGGFPSAHLVVVVVAVRRFCPVGSSCDQVVTLGRVRRSTH